MKKMSAILGSILLAGMMTVSAGAVDEAEILGTWYLTSMDFGGAAINPASLGMEMSMDFAEDGSCLLLMTGEDDSNASWTLDGDVITVDDGNAPMELNFADGELTTVQDDVGMTFSREMAEAEVYDPGAVIDDPELADFDGVWNCVMLDIFGMQMPPEMGDLEFRLTIADGNCTLYYNDGDSELEKELTGELTGDTLLLKNPDDPEDFEMLVDTDNLNLRIHENGVLSYSNKDFSAEEPETEMVMEDESETESLEADFDTTYAVYFEKE